MWDIFDTFGKRGSNRLHQAVESPNFIFVLYNLIIVKECPKIV